jgi:hypothetical protein
MQPFLTLSPPIVKLDQKHTFVPTMDMEQKPSLNYNTTMPKLPPKSLMMPLLAIKHYDNAQMKLQHPTCNALMLPSTTAAN